MSKLSATKKELQEKQNKAPSDGKTYGLKDGALVELTSGGAVDSVNGKVGVVVLNTDDIAQGTNNKYITQAQINKLNSLDNYGFTSGSGTTFNVYMPNIIELYVGLIVSVEFTEIPETGATLNVNGFGDSPIIVNGAFIQGDYLNLGAVIQLVWVGSYWKLYDKYGGGDLSNYYTKVQTDGLLNEKVQRMTGSTTYPQVYFKQAEGTTTGLRDFSALATPNAIAQRNALGQLEGVDATSSTQLATKGQMDGGLASKQNTLVSGTNIKTVGGISILGSGDIPISGGGGQPFLYQKFTGSGNYTVDASLYPKGKIILELETSDSTTGNLNITISNIFNAKLDDLIIYGINTSFDNGNKINVNLTSANSVYTNISYGSVSRDYPSSGIIADIGHADYGFSFVCRYTYLQSGSLSVFSLVYEVDLM